MSEPLPDNVDEKLTKKLGRIDKIIAYNLVFMNVIIIALFVFVLFANQSYLEQNRIIGARNHELTRQYIKCIATILMKPISERTPDAFDKCGIDGVSLSKLEEDMAKDPPDNNTMIFFEPQAKATEIVIRKESEPTSTYRVTMPQRQSVAQQPSPQPQQPIVTLGLQNPILPLSVSVNPPNVGNNQPVNGSGVNEAPEKTCTGSIGSPLGITCS